MPHSDSDPDDLNVSVQWRALPDYISRRREHAAAQNGRRAAALAPLIEAHLIADRAALDGLEKLHTQIADETNLALDGDNRQAAVWTVAGRCIGLARAVLVLLEAGFTAEAAAEARVLHEAARLLSALADEDESGLLRRWLDDEDKQWVRPGEARRAGERQRERVAQLLPEALRAAREVGDERSAAQLEEAIESGVMMEDGLLADSSLQIYDVLSRIGHNRRSGMHDAISVRLRLMATGPHPDPLTRAEYVDWASHIIEEVVLTVSDALAPFWPRGSVVQAMRALVGVLEHARQHAPIDASARNALACRT